MMISTMGSRQEGSNRAKTPTKPSHTQSSYQKEGGDSSYKGSGVEGIFGFP
jgi:hypothetical protein